MLCKSWKFHAHIQFVLRDFPHNQHDESISHPLDHLIMSVTPNYVRYLAYMSLMTHGTHQFAPAFRLSIHRQNYVFHQEPDASVCSIASLSKRCREPSTACRITPMYFSGTLVSQIVKGWIKREPMDTSVHPTASERSRTREDRKQYAFQNEIRYSVESLWQTIRHRK